MNHNLCHFYKYIIIYRVYAQNQLGLDLLAQSRFSKAVAALSTTAPTSKQPPQKPSVAKPVRVLISTEEHKALQDINTRREEIKKTINKELVKVNKLNETSKLNTKQLNKFRKDMIYQINQRVDQLINESDKIINDKKDIIGKNIKSLQDLDKSLNNADSQCNQLLDDTSIDIGKRKTKLLKVSANALKQEMKETQVGIKVGVKIDNDGVIGFINKIGQIVDEEEVYIVPALSVTDIKDTSATVLFCLYACAICFVI